MNVIERYLDYTEDTESPTQFHRWAFISCISAALGRKIWIKFGHKNIYPNMYVMLVGAPATRKSTAIDMAKMILKESGYYSFSFSKTSKEKFLMDLEEGFELLDQDGQYDAEKALSEETASVMEQGRQCFICCDEFVDFIGQSNINFINLLTTLWDNREDSYAERLKNSKSVRIPKPTINLLGGITPVSFASAMPPEVIGQGFSSRVILIHQDPSGKKITFPEPPDESIKEELVSFFQQIQNFKGECTLTPESKKLIDKIYKGWDNLSDIRLQYYCGRRLTHLLKLCMVCAVCSGTTVISPAIVKQANTILTYSERSMHRALGEFGENRNSKVMQHILDFMGGSKGPVDVEGIFKAVSMDIAKTSQLSEVLQSLIQAAKIETVHVNGHTKFQLANRDAQKNTYAVDYTQFIREYEEEEEDEIELDLESAIDDAARKAALLEKMKKTVREGHNG